MLACCQPWIQYSYAEGASFLLPTALRLLPCGGTRKLATETSATLATRSLLQTRTSNSEARTERGRLTALGQVAGQELGKTFPDEENLGFTFNPDGRADLQSAQVRRNLFLQITNNDDGRKCTRFDPSNLPQALTIRNKKTDPTPLLSPRLPKAEPTYPGRPQQAAFHLG